MKHFLIAAVALVPISTAAVAQDNDDYRVRIGLGAQLQPKAIGSEETEIGPLWDVDVAKGSSEFRFEAPDDSTAIKLISTGGFSFGPALNIQSSRKNSDFDAPVGKVKTTFEAGGFMQFYVTESTRLRAELRKGIGGHKGLVGYVGADQIWRDGDNYVFSVGPRVRFSDDRYQGAYFGLTPVTALATGLPAYDPDGGVHAVGIASGMSYQFTPRWGLFGYAGYDRLVGDAARSPIVRNLGSRDQLSGGLGLSYTFTFAR